MWKTAFKKFEVIWSALEDHIICLRRPYHFKFFKGYLPQILLGPFLSTLSDMIVHGNSDPCLTIKHFHEALQPESQLCTGWSFCWIRFKTSNILMKNYRLVPEGHQYLKVSNIWNCRCYLFSNEPKKNKKNIKTPPYFKFEYRILGILLFNP